MVSCSEGKREEGRPSQELSFCSRANASGPSKQPIKRGRDSRSTCKKSYRRDEKPLHGRWTSRPEGLQCKAASQGDGHVVHPGKERASEAPINTGTWKLLRIWGRRQLLGRADLS